MNESPHHSPGSRVHIPSIVEPDPARPLTLEFRADAREYFRIWIVNLCLTLLTLGVFSAWAKVRKKRYFYSHVELDGTPFQYLAEPVPILKGRIIAAVLFFAYYISSNYFTVAFPYVLAAGIVLAPWVVMRAAQFNAHYSAYRNLRFKFDSSYRDALWTIYWLGIIPWLALGTIFSWWGSIWLGGISWAVFLATFPWWACRLKRYIATRTVFGGKHATMDARGVQFFVTYLCAAGIVMLAGLLTVVPIFVLPDSVSRLGSSVILLSIPVYAGYVLAYAVVQAWITNIVWRHTRIGPVGFESTLTGLGLCRLYLGNAAAIVLSLGMLTPWAVVRTYRYRIDNLGVFATGGPEAFDGGDAAAVHAAGSEVGEFFDIDVSL